MMLSWMEWNTKLRENWTPECTLPNKKERRKLYNEYREEKKMELTNINCGTSVTTAYIDAPKKCRLENWFIKDSLACVECKPCPTPAIDWSGYQEGINPMNYATATVQAGTTETQDQRKYLSKRLDEIFYKKESPLCSHFGLTDDEAPRTPKELAERIASGKFVIKGLNKVESDDFIDDEYFHGYWTSMLRWRDPAKKADQEGYDAARKDLSEKRQAALDIIKIDEPKAGLEAVKAFEAWEPKSAAN